MNRVKSCVACDNPSTGPTRYLYYTPRRHGPYFSVLEDLQHEDNLHEFRNNRCPVCTSCATFLIRQWKNYDKQGTPSEKRQFTLLSEERMKRLNEKRENETEKENLKDLDDERRELVDPRAEESAVKPKQKFRSVVEKQRQKQSPREPKLRAIVHKRQTFEEKKDVNFPAIESGKASQQSWMDEERKELIGLKRETEEMLRLQDAKLAEQVEVQKQREKYIQEEVAKRLQKEQDILFKKLAEMKFENEQKLAQEKLKLAMVSVDKLQLNRTERISEIVDEMKNTFAEEMEEKKRDYSFWLHHHSFDSKDQMQLLQELEKIRQSRETQESRMIAEMEKERELRRKAEAVLQDEKQKLERMRVEMSDKIASLIQEQREREEKMKLLVQEEVARFSRQKDSSGYGSYHSPRSFRSDSVSEREEHTEPTETDNRTLDRKTPRDQSSGRNRHSRNERSSTTSDELRELNSPVPDSRGSSPLERSQRHRRKKERQARNAAKNWEREKSHSPKPRKQRGYEDKDMMFS